MSKKTLLFGTIASIIAVNSVFADTTTSTVTSKNYVDAEVAKKQNIIETGLVDFENNWDGHYEINDMPALVSYETETGVVGNKYGIIAQSNVENWGFECDSFYCGPMREADYLIPTAAAVQSGYGRLYDDKQNKMTCAGWPDGVAHTDENCWLWQK